MRHVFPKTPIKQVNLVGSQINEKRKGVNRSDVVTAAMLAKRYRISVDKVRSLHLVYTAHEDIKFGLEKKLITLSQAYLLARIPEQQRQLNFYSMCLVRKTSVRQLARAIKLDAPATVPTRATQIETSPEILRFLSLVGDKIGSPLKISHDTKKEIFALEVLWTGHDQMLELTDKLMLKDTHHHTDFLQHGYDTGAQMPYGIIRVVFHTVKDYEDTIVKFANRVIPEEFSR